MTDKQHDINDLADQLDRILPPGQHDAPQGDSDPILDAAVRLANAPRAPMPPDVLARIQAKVVETHRQQIRQKQPLRVYRISRYLAAASVIIVLFFAGFIPVMAGSVPGDILYPVKTRLENVELTLATSEGRAEVYLTHAERRTEEAHILLARGTFEETLLTRALDSMLESAASARQHNNIPALSALGTRMVAVNAGLDALLLEAELRQLAPPTVLSALRERLESARDSGDLQLSDSTSSGIEATPEVVETDSPIPSPTATATASFTPVPTHTSTSTFTDSPTATPSNTPSPTATSTLELFIEVSAEVTESVEAVSSGTPIVSAIIRATGPVNVRNGPGAEYVVIATLQPGVRVLLLGWNEDVTWLNIRLDDGRSGWIASALTNLYYLAAPSASSTDEVGTQGNNGGQGADGQGNGNQGNDGQGGDFGCEHPGNYCNAPGQGGDNPGQGGGQGQGGGKP